MYAKLSSSLAKIREQMNKGRNFAYFRPRQPRGPRENGWLASLTSVQAGSIQREGSKT
jgi:hypothetical protein